MMEGPLVDIVLVYTLGDVILKEDVSSWWSKGRTKPRARIIPFVYNQVVRCYSYSAMTNIAEDLLRELRTQRRTTPNRPLIFIARSLAGLIIKRAIFMALLSTDADTIGLWAIAIVLLETAHSPTLMDYQQSPKSPKSQLATSDTEPSDAEMSSDLLRILREFQSIASLFETALFLTEGDLYQPGSKALQGYHFAIDLPYEEVFLTAAEHQLLCELEHQLHVDGSVLDALLGLLRNVVHRTRPNGLQQQGIWQDRAAVSPWYPGTCSWVLSHPTFQTWFAGGPRPILWVTGPTGTGKTVLSSYLVEQLRESQKHHLVACYFFFGRNHSNDWGNLAIQVLVRNLLAQKRKTLSNLLLYKILASVHADARALAPSEIQAHLRTIFHNIADDENLVLILDGSEEMAWLQKLVVNEVVHLTQEKEKGAPSNVRCIISSRPFCSTESGRFDLSHKKILSIDLGEEVAIQDDIRIFITSKISELSRDNPLSQPLRKRLIQDIIVKSGNSFLWATLAFQLLDITSRHDQSPDVAISSMPDDLFAMYGLLLSAIPRKDRPTTTKLLSLAIGALRPLHLTELLDALAEGYMLGSMHSIAGVMDSSHFHYTGDSLSQLSGGLVMVSDNHTIYLVHNTVEDFLLSDCARGLLQDVLDQYRLHERIATMCLEAINSAGMRSEAKLHRCQHTSELTTSSEGSYFLQYASQSWWSHCKRAGSRSNSLPDVLHSLLGLSQEPRSTQSSVRGLTDSKTKGVNFGLRVCSQFGFAVLGQSCLDMGADPDVMSETSVTSLHLAAAHGHLEMVKILLDRGADVSPKISTDQKTPLHLAASSGHTATVDLLLQRGADLDAGTAVLRETPLHLAVARNHSETATLLLKWGADPSTETHFQETPLHFAAAYGCQTLVSLLIGERVTTVKDDGNHCSSCSNVCNCPLSMETPRDNLSSSMGFLEVLTAMRNHQPRFKFSNDSKAPLEVKNNLGRTALHLAALHGHKDIVRSLLSLGSNAQMVDDYGYTALEYAEEHGQEAIVKLLREQVSGTLLTSARHDTDASDYTMVERSTKLDRGGYSCKQDLKQRVDEKEHQGPQLALRTRADEKMKADGTDANHTHHAYSTNEASTSNANDMLWVLVDKTRG